MQTVTLERRRRWPPASVNVGGAISGAFSADADGSGGTAYSLADTIDATAANAGALWLVYQTQRYGRMTYTIPGLTPGAAYTVRLHFAELYYGVHGHGGGAGSRTFNVAINGTSALTNFDVFATAGAADKAVIVDTASTASNTGTLAIALTNGTGLNNPMLSAIQILGVSGVATGPSAAPSAAPTATPSATPVGSEMPRSSDAFVDAPA